MSEQRAFHNRVRSLDFYVYEHWRPDTNLPFYVGKGRDRRAYDLSRKTNLHHTNINKKLVSLGLKILIVIVAGGLSEERAYALEKRRITLWRRRGIKLVNIADGGIGPVGRTFSDKAKAKMSAAAKLRWKTDAAFREKMLSPEVIRRRVSAGQTPEARAKRKASLNAPSTLAKLSVRQKQLMVSVEHRARCLSGLNSPKSRAKAAKTKQTDEYRAKVSNAHKGKRPSIKTRAKLRAAKLGRKLSAEHIAKIVAANTGKKRSDAARANLREGQRRRFIKAIENGAAA